MKQEVKDLGKGFILSMILAFFVIVFIAIIYGVRYYSAETRGKVVMEENVTSGRAQEFSYNVFFDQCAAIQGYESALVTQQSLLKTAEGDQAARTQTNIAAITSQRARAITQYNADARKVKTMARFKDSGLPDQININTEHTSCQN